MLNVESKETPGQRRKPITENVLLELGKHKEGPGEVSRPPYPKHRRRSHMEENYPAQHHLISLFTGGKKLK